MSKQAKTTAVFVSGFVLACLAACSSVDAPTASFGGTIEGKVSYAGAAHKNLRNPALSLAVFSSFPPQGAPHAALLIRDPDFSQPLPYRLTNVVPFEYKIVAMLVDLDAPAPMGPTTMPTGSYTTFCALTDPKSSVAVRDGEVTGGIDITLWDQGGAADPCNKPKGSVCPKAGKATLELKFKLDRAPELLVAPDLLRVAMFASFPGPPSAFTSVPAADVGSFPYTLALDEAPAGDFVIYGCYDVGGDGAFGCTDSDFAAYYMDKAKLKVEAGRIHTVAMDLDAGTGTLEGTFDPKDRGCP